jgi:signal transduction histidine kinase
MQTKLEKENKTHIPLRITEKLVKLRLHFVTDVVRLQQVLINLIDNAIKYNVEGGSITCFSGEKDGLILIGIRDTGSGIAADQLERILQGSSFNSRGSLGIGLLLARDLVERNGGRIYAESEPGTGSTFYFTWPGKKIE